MPDEDHIITFHVLTMSFFIVVFVEIPLLIAYGIVTMFNHASDDMKLGVEWILVFYALIFTLEAMLLILSAIRDIGRMSKKV